jgi:glycosyltransferase involved in cell wall biosynthesis
MRKVLIISYYWPPSGGGGVQRWAKMCKYFKSFSWEPIVYVPENPDYPITDHSFDEDVQDVQVLKGRITEPSRILRKLGAKNEAGLSSGFVSNKKSLTQQLAIAIRGNFFIPDARKLWISPSIKTLSKWLKNNEVDAIISTGPPHSCHMIALGLKKKFDIPWVSDFRDPWTNIDFYNDLHLSSFADRQHKRMEKEVLSSADVVVSIGKTLCEELQALGARKSAQITNGYDSIQEAGTLDKEFSLLHIGRLGKSRNPKVLWEVLAEMCKEDELFLKLCRVRLVGNVDGEVRESVKEKGLESIVEFVENVSNSTSLGMQRASQVLLLLINDTPNANGILTGKFFEYLSTNRPIVCVGPKEGDAAEILRNSGAGETFSFTQSQELKSHLQKQFEQYKKGKLAAGTTKVAEYSRESLAKKYTEVLNGLVND